MIKKILTILSIIFLAALIFTSCLHRDVPEKETQHQNTSSLEETRPEEIPPYKIVEIGGVEYLQSRGETGKPGGTFYSSMIGEGPKTFNYWNSKDATSSSIAGTMFEGLFITDPYSGKVIPRLAKSYSVDKTGKVYTVTLRKGLKWSDDKEITADDVLFTFNTIIKGGYGDTSARDVMLVDGKMPAAEKVDKYTIKFTTPKPFAPFLRMLGFPIAPKHKLEPVTKKGIAEFNQYWGVTTAPKDFVVSGMFKLKEYVPAQRVILEKNPNFAMTDKLNQKLPYLDTYVIYIVGDLNNQILKFEANEIDYLNVRGNQVARFKQKEKASNYKMYNLGAGDGTTFITFNLNRRKNDKGQYYVDPVKQKWFNDINFRRAVDYAIDRDFIVSNILEGVGSPLFTAEGLSSIFLDKELAKGHPRDLNYARELLKKSGFYYDKKGNLYDKEGHLVEFTMLTNAGNTERESVGVMVKEDLKELGMKVNFKPIEFNVLVGKITGAMDWDAIILGLTGSSLEPNNGANVWRSDGTLHMFNLRQGKDALNKADLRPWEAQIDDIFLKGALELDFNKRKAIYDQYQQIAYEQQPFIYLYTPLNIVAIRKHLGNINPTPLGGPVHNLEEIYIK
ncbi:MAG: ABC transporter substrate-binding protein [Candidatus Gastranaerophilales bacterium]|nr:ABC transporter substrate-binding protein [Candidatus Gastranaerophilales bacterium]